MMDLNRLTIYTLKHSDGRYGYVVIMPEDAPELNEAQIRLIGNFIKNAVFSMNSKKSFVTESDLVTYKTQLSTDVLKQRAIVSWGFIIFGE